ncbi:MAG: hypothetical protein IJJ38_06305 [Lachnospiraceae bacterium]|nr:hypothetical protein [Lachnospiraceae bacterium]
MSNSGRIVKFDNVRGFLIVLVVLCHFLDFYAEHSLIFRGVYLFAYAFHMPLFFFLAGWFHRNKKTREKLFYYLSLYLLLKVMAYCLDVLMGKNASLSLFSAASLPWFMAAMAAFTGIAAFLENADGRTVLLISLTAGCFSGFDGSIGNQFVLARVFVFFPFFWAGKMAADGERTSDFILNGTGKFRTAGAAVLCAWGALCLLCTEKLYFLRPYFNGRFPYPSPDLSEAALRAGCYVLSFILCFAVLSLFDERRTPLAVPGRQSLSVFFWHYPLAMLTNHFHLMHICRTVPGKLLYVIPVLFIPFLLSCAPFTLPLEKLRRGCMGTEQIHPSERE